MADPKDPQKEIVHITPPSTAEADTGMRETARINLPASPPSNGGASRAQIEPLPRPVPPATSGQPERPPLPPTAASPIFLPPKTALSPSNLPPPSTAPRPANVSLPPPKVTEQIPASLMPAASSLESDASALTMPVIAPPPSSSASPSPGPKKETARIMVAPDPPLKAWPAVEMKKTQPPILMPWCWALLGASILTLLIQIWNYFA